MASPQFQALVSTALKSGVEVTIASLATCLQAEGLALDQLDAVSRFLSEWNFDLRPPLTTGDFTTPRVMRPRALDMHTAETVEREMRDGESSQIEFKSSLLYDHKRSQAAPDTPFHALKSEAVLYSVLKTIGAFLNSQGGILFVGVSDDQTVKGLAEDCQLLGCQGFNADRWQLELRNHLTGKFKDGGLINDYVQVAFVPMTDRIIARVQVLARQRLSFLKQDDNHRLCRRQGNRTLEVPYFEIEEFLEARMKA